MTGEFFYSSTVLKRLKLCEFMAIYFREQELSSFLLPAVILPCLLPYGEPVAVTAAFAGGIRAYLPHLVLITYIRT